MTDLAKVADGKNGNGRDAAGGNGIKLYPAIDKPEVRTFLESKARNSKNTAESYREGIYRFDQFLRASHPKTDAVTVLKGIRKKQLDVYKLFDQFISYLQGHEYTVASIRNFLAGVRSYVQYHDIDVIPAKFKHKVTMPNDRKEDEYALDREEIRKILTNIRQQRLKTYCIVLACGGMRAEEGLAIRAKDIDFNVQPTKIYMQAQYAKNKLPREIYITAEATHFLKTWLEHKYGRGQHGNPDDLVFAVMDEATPQGMYTTIANQFRHALKSIDLDDRKKDKHNRGVITLHSFRRYVETIIEDHTSANFADYILGHKKSPYYTKKEHERRAKYAECERYLTYLDYTGVDMQNKTIEGAITEEKQRIESLEARLEKTEKGYQDYREASNKLLSALATELEKKGAGKEEIISALATALDAIARTSTPEEIAEAQGAKKALEKESQQSN